MLVLTSHRKGEVGVGGGGGRDWNFQETNQTFTPIFCLSGAINCSAFVMF